jgi:Ca2+/H+ antiporter
MKVESYLINLFHIFIVAPFLYYIASQKGNANPLVFTILLYIVYGIIIFHSYLTYTKIYKKNETKECMCGNNNCTCEK